MGRTSLFISISGRLEGGKNCGTPEGISASGRPEELSRERRKEWD